MRKLIPIAAVLVIALGIYVAIFSGGDEEVTDAPTTVKIMIALPSDLEVVKEMINGAQLAYDQAGGTAGDTPVALVMVNTYNADNPPDASKDAAAAQQAVADEGVIAVLGGSDSSRAQISIPILNESSIPLISGTATQPSLTKSGFVAGEPGSYYPTGQRNFFRVIPSDDVQAGVAARWMQQQGIQTVYILALDTPYSTGLAGIFEVNAPDLGMEIVANETIPFAEIPAETIQTVAQQIIEANPDAVYYPIRTVGNGLDLIAAVLAEDEDIIFVGGDGLSGEEGRDLHSFPAMRVFATNTPPAASLPSAAPLITAYQEAYNTAPHPFAVNSYEAMNVLLAAIDRADPPTRENVLKALRELGDYSGMLGNWHFDENGDTSLTTLSMMQLQDQEWVSVEVVN